MRGKSHSDETRAAVVAALLTGQSVSQVAAEFKLGKATVSRWRGELGSNKLEQVRTQKGESLESLLMDYVCQNLQTLKAQSEVAGREDYIKRQPASELAVLHGVMADKAFRILSALQPEPELEYGQHTDPAREAATVS